MSRRVLTVDRYKEIERLLAAGRGVREITRALKCSRRLVRQIRDGLHGPPDQPRSTADPPWMVQVSWPEIVHDLGAESDYRTERKTKRRIKAAKFAIRPTFQDFDFTANRSISRSQIKDLYSLQWLTDCRPVCS